MAIPLEQCVEQSEHQTLPKSDAPTQREQANAKHGHDFASAGRSHHFTIDHAQRPSPKEQFVDEQQRHRKPKDADFPSVHLKMLPVHALGSHGEKKRYPRGDDGSPEWKQTQHH